MAWEPQVRQKLARFASPPLHESPEALAESITRLEEPLGLFSMLTREEAAWIAAASPDYGEGRLFAKIYCQASGMDYEMFKRAEYAAYSFCARSDDRYGPMVGSIYGLLSRTIGPSASGLREAIRSNAMMDLDDGMFSRFSMRWMAVADYKNTGYPKEILERAGNDRERLELYMDAPVGFVITYKGVENALCSMWPESPDTLLIHQLQGVRKKRFRGHVPAGRLHSQGLSMFDFRKAMVELSESVAKESGFPKLGIRGARNNIWTNTDDDGNPHITMDRALELYDGTAMRLGFEGTRNGNWYKSVQP